MNLDELAEAVALVARYYRVVRQEPTKWEKQALRNRLTELGIVLKRA